MQTAMLSLICSSFITTTYEDKKPTPEFSEEEKDLYKKIVLDLLNCCKERIKHPNPQIDSLNGQPDPGYVVIFRQSRSWRKVERMFNEVNSRDVHVNSWVRAWIEQIGKFRTYQHGIQDHVEQLQNFKQQVIKGYLTPQERAGLRFIDRIAKEKVRDILIQLKQDVDDAEKSLSNIDRRVARNPQCFKIINYLKEYWQHLILFSDWYEVSVDDEKTFVQIRRPDTLLNAKTGATSLASLINHSTKAIFSIEVKSHKIVPFEYKGEEPGQIMYPTKIDFKEKHFAFESPFSQRRSIDFRLSDDMIYGVNFGSQPYVEAPRISATARKLERIVRQAFRIVNEKLNQPRPPLKISHDKEEDIHIPDPNLPKKATYYSYNQFLSSIVPSFLLWGLTTNEQNTDEQNIENY